MAAGIGGGYNGKGNCNVTINGGTVTATSRRGAGIGSGAGQTGVATITINGGTVTATANTDGAGIGSGRNAQGATISINGGTVTASSASGAGIGNGVSSKSTSSITLKWTPESKVDMSVTASSYGGTVTFQKGFAIEGENAPLTQDTISTANGKEIVPCHVHNWTSVTRDNGNTFTMTCANDDEFYSSDTEHGPLTKTMRIVSPGDSLVYDGETSFPAVILDSENQSQSMFTISYEKQKAGNWAAMESAPLMREPTAPAQRQLLPTAILP